MQIIIRLPASDTITLDVGASDTIDTVKALTRNSTRIPKCKQSLSFNGKEDLDDTRTLRSYRMKNGAIGDLKLAVKGAGARQQQCKKDLMLKKKVFVTTGDDRLLFQQAYDVSLQAMTMNVPNAIALIRRMSIEDLTAITVVLDHGKETFAVKLKDIVSYVPEFRKLTVIEGMIATAKDRMSDVVMEAMVETFVKESGAVNIELLKQEIRISLEIKKNEPRATGSASAAGPVNMET